MKQSQTTTQSVGGQIEHHFTKILKSMELGKVREMGAGIHCLALLNSADHAPQISIELLHRATCRMHHLISEKFKGGARFSKQQVAGFWRGLQSRREAFSSLVYFTEGQAARFSIEIPEELSVRAQSVLLTGPERIVDLKVSSLRLLEARLELSAQFQEYDTAAKQKIVDELRATGAEQIISGGNHGGSLSVSRISRIVLSNYGFASVPVAALREGHRNTHFNIPQRQINLNQNDFQVLTNEQRMLVLLHELRHAIQHSLIDNFRFHRHDGSPVFYKQGRMHDAVARFPTDIERLIIGSYTSPFNSELAGLSEEAQQKLYAAKFSERDADTFASHILSLLLKRDSQSILEGYRAEHPPQLSSAPTPQESSLVTKLETTLILDQPFARNLALPSKDNGWNSGNLREATLLQMKDRFGQREKEDSSNNLLLSTPSSEEKIESVLPSPLLERDPELYSRNLRSLSFKATTADFTTSDSIRSSLPELIVLSRQLLCGENGLKILHQKSVEALQSVPMEQDLARLLTELVVELAQRVEVKTPKKVSRRLVVAALLHKESADIPVHGKGEQESLLDSTYTLMTHLNAGRLLQAALYMRIMKRHIEQGWLGVIQRRQADRLISEMLPSLNIESDNELKDMFTRRINAVQSALRS